MIAKSLKGVPGGRGLEITTLQHLSLYGGAYLVAVVGEWVWIGLCLVEVLHTCEVPPTLVPSHLFHHVNHITVTSKVTLMSPAASIILTMSQRFPQTTRAGEGTWEGSQDRLIKLSLSEAPQKSLQYNLWTYFQI